MRLSMTQPIVVPHASQPTVDGAKTAVNGINIQLIPTVFHILFQFSLDTLQRIVDGFDMTMELFRNFLIGKPLKIFRPDNSLVPSTPSQKGSPPSSSQYPQTLPC